jgi:hypothetical protein
MYHLHILFLSVALHRSLYNLDYVTLFPVCDISMKHEVRSTESNEKMCRSVAVNLSVILVFRLWRSLGWKIVLVDSERGVCILPSFVSKNVLNNLRDTQAYTVYDAE